MGVLRAEREVLSILSHASQQHVAEMVDKTQIVCPLAKVDAFVEMANKNELAVTAALAKMAD